MVLVLIVLLLALLLFGVGFTAHFLWFIAAVVLVAWLIGWAIHGGSGGRWYGRSW